MIVMSGLMRRIKLVLFLGLVFLFGCTGEQSMFTSAGPYAQSIVWLTKLMTVSATLITLLIVVLTGLALFAPVHWKKRIATEQNIVLGGIVFPVVVLSVLLVYGFVLLAQAEKQVRSEDALHIEVVGEQWWWRFIYTLENGEKIETANELRLPVNRPVTLHLSTADVIHSFWIPAYGGKLDMIPGRENKMDIFIKQTGVSRGQCAEYCGGAHALMSLYSIAMLPEDFEQWLQQESLPARNTVNPNGREIFVANGCGSCHQIRGTSATGSVGPDLTHVGSRLTIGAGVMRVSQENFAEWINRHQRIKPDNLMPDYTFLNDKDVESLARYLSQLK